VTPETPGPDRLEALLAGSATPRDAAERDLVALARELAASEPRLPDGLDERIDAALDRPAPARAGRRPLAALRGRPWLALAPAAALAAAVVGVVVAVRARDSGAPPAVRTAVERPEAAPSSGLARSAAAGVVLRSGPGRRYAVVASLPAGARIRVACVVPGERVAGPRIASDLWARVGPGRYAPVALLPAGVARGAGRCAPLRRPSGTP
jgi:uncharacterized protein YraI